jgi:hypothetical protein
MRLQERGIAGAIIKREMRKKIIDLTMALHRRLAQRLSGAAGVGRYRHSAFLRPVTA